MQTLLSLLDRLRKHNVEFVIVGGMAGVVHGCTLVTEDLDVCAPFTPANLNNLLEALDGLSPCHRMSPRRPHLQADVSALSRFHNLYLVTSSGQLDILDSVDGVGDYERVLQKAIPVDVQGRQYHVLDLDGLIAAKEALGRPKDAQAVAQLRAIRARRSGNDSAS